MKKSFLSFCALLAITLFCSCSNAFENLSVQTSVSINPARWIFSNSAEFSYRLTVNASGENYNSSQSQYGSKIKEEAVFTFEGLPYGKLINFEALLYNEDEDTLLYTGSVSLTAGKTNNVALTLTQVEQETAPALEITVYNLRDDENDYFIYADESPIFFLSNQNPDDLNVADITWSIVGSYEGILIQKSEKTSSMATLSITDSNSIKQELFIKVKAQAQGYKSAVISFKIKPLMEFSVEAYSYIDGSNLSINNDELTAFAYGMVCISFSAPKDYEDEDLEVSVTLNNTSEDEQTYEPYEGDSGFEVYLYGNSKSITATAEHFKAKTIQINTTTDITNCDRLEYVCEIGGSYTIKNDLQITNTLYVTKELTLVAEKNVTLYRAQDFTDTMIRVGANAYSEEDWGEYYPYAKLTLKGSKNAQITLSGKTDEFSEALSATCPLLYVNQGEHNLEYVNFCDSCSTDLAGAIYISDASDALKINFTNCNFSSNSMDTTQVGTSPIKICAYNEDTVSFTNCNFSSNSNNTGAGGAISIFSSSNVSFEGCTFSKNSANNYGADIYIQASTVDFKSTTLLSTVEDGNYNLYNMRGTITKDDTSNLGSTNLSS